MPSSERWASRRPSSGLKRKAWRMREQSRRFAKDMLGRYEPIETMRSWPSNGLRVGAVRNSGRRALSGRGHREHNSPRTWVTHVGDRVSRTQPRYACVARSGGRASAVQGYPVELAAKVAVASVRSSVQEFATIEEVVFSCFCIAVLRHCQRITARI